MIWKTTSGAKRVQKTGKASYSHSVLTYLPTWRCFIGKSIFLRNFSMKLWGIVCVAILLNRNGKENRWLIAKTWCQKLSKSQPRLIHDRLFVIPVSKWWLAVLLILWWRPCVLRSRSSGSVELQNCSACHEWNNRTVNLELDNDRDIMMTNHGYVMMIHYSILIKTYLAFGVSLEKLTLEN